MRNLFLFAVQLFCLPVVFAQQPGTVPAAPVPVRPYSLLHPVPRAAMRPMSTDRPDATESAYSVDAGHTQVETDLVRLGRQRFSPNDTHEELGLNHANVKLGLTRTTDVQLVVESYTRQTERGPEHLSLREGFGDLTLRLKRNLWGNDSGRTALAVMPFVKIPTGQRTGNRAFEGGIVVPFAWQLPHDWTFGSQFQTTVLRDTDAGCHYAEIAATATVGHDLYRTLGSFVELSGAWDTHVAGDARWAATLNGGPILRIGSNTQFDLGINLPLVANLETTYFLGLSLRR